MNRQAYTNTAALCLGCGASTAGLFQVADLARVLGLADALGQRLLSRLLGFGSLTFLPEHAGQVEVGLAVLGHRRGLLPVVDRLGDLVAVVVRLGQRQVGL